MRYVILSVLKGEAGEFNNKLRKDVWQKFKAKSSKLPAHFTIKAPFECDGDINDLQEILESFSKDNNACNYEIEGYGHFNNRVIFMKVNMSDEGKAVHDRLIEKMSVIPYIKFDKKDGKDKVFHITVASKNINHMYDDIWKYVNTYSCDFKNCYFDNIAIYRWENNTWNLFKEYTF